VSSDPLQAGVGLGHEKDGHPGILSGPAPLRDSAQLSCRLSQASCGSVRAVLLPLLAAGDLGVGVWLLWLARRHYGWDQPGIPVTGVLLLMCALFLAWLALQHPAAPAVTPSRPSVPVLI